MEVKIIRIGDFVYSGYYSPNHSKLRCVFCGRNTWTQFYSEKRKKHYLMHPKCAKAVSDIVVMNKE